MRIGPVTQTDFAKLKEILDGAGCAFEVFLDEAVKNEPRLASNPVGIVSHPTYEPMNPYIYLEVSSAGLLLIKEQLEKMGIAAVEREIKEVEGEEYLCPQCDFSSETPRLCPTHRVPLVDYSTWRRTRKGQSKIAGYSVIIALLLLAIGLYFGWSLRQPIVPG